METFDRSYQSAIVSIALCCTIYEIFQVEEYRDLEILVELLTLQIYPLSLHHRNLQISLPLIVWFYLHSILHSKLQKEMIFGK